MPMLRTSAWTSLALTLALVATQASAQQAHHEPQPPNATAGSPTQASPQGGPAGTMPGAPATIATPRTVINNTFNPTGPTGTGTFSPTANFFVCVDDDGVAGTRSSGMKGMMPGMMPGMMSGMMGGARHVEGRIAFLKAELKITDAQLPLWNAVAGAMRDHAKGMATMPGETTGTLPERFAALEKAMSARLDAVQRLKTAVDPLYTALTDEQKKAADELTADMGDATR